MVVSGVSSPKLRAFPRHLEARKMEADGQGKGDLPVNLMAVHLRELFVPVIEKIGKVEMRTLESRQSAVDRGSLIYRSK